MNYPLISEYIEAIKPAEVYYEQLKHLRPLQDDDGQPMMSSGNFAVVFMTQFGLTHRFKMKDKDKFGGYKFIPLSTLSILSPGDTIELSKK